MLGKLLKSSKKTPVISTKEIVGIKGEQTNYDCDL